MNKHELDKQMSKFRFVQPEENNWVLGNDIHIWKFSSIATRFFLLTPEEIKITNRFRSESDRNRFAVARQALRVLLSKYLSVSQMDIHIHSEKGMKPYITSPPSDIQFNISHSGDCVLIAFALDELGIDVEKINPQFNFVHLLEDHFSAGEKSFITEAADPVSAFYYLWTRKEALIKAWGTGLHDNLKQVLVLPADSPINRENKLWVIESFQVSPMYPAALAYSGRDQNLKYLEGNYVFNHTA